MDCSHLIDTELLTEDIIDPRWESSPYYKLKLMKAKQAGSRYEKIAKNILEKLGHNVEKPTSTDHDCIVDGKKMELKGSMVNKGTDDRFSFLQIRPAQDYEVIGFLCIYFDRVEFHTMTKDEVLAKIEQGVFGKQHGGNKANSGTYCYNGAIENLIDS